nr:hypothetical protein Itr_chr01CG01060 [Ipomoea trifida]
MGSARSFLSCAVGKPFLAEIPLLSNTIAFLLEMKPDVPMISHHIPGRTVALSAQDRRGRVSITTDRTSK